MNPGDETEPELIDPDASLGGLSGADRTEVVGDTRGRYLVTVGVAVTAAFLLVALVFSGGGSSDPDPAGIDQLTFITEDGSEATLADFTGEPLVVNFFASWCAPCRAELPDFQEVHLASEGRVRFLGISHDIDEASWRSIVEETGVTYPTVFQPEQEIFETLNLLGMPSTVLIAPDGEVVHKLSGIVNQEVLEQLIAEHLAVEV